MMNRRNVLIGLGGIVAGGGALLSSGAFSQVEAQRSVTINTAGDDSALLQIQSADANYDAFFSNAGSGAIEINIGDLGANLGDGLNEDAVTAFDDVIQITNEGTQDVDLSLDTSGDGVSLYHGDFPGSDFTGDPLTSVPTLAADTTGPGDSVTIGIAVDTGMDADFPAGTIADAESADVTIVASTP